MATPPPADDPSVCPPSAARQRSEARKQKLLAQGNDRLARITGAMKGRQPAPEQPSTNDPPEVDISASPSPSKPPSHSRKPRSSPSSSSLKSRKSKSALLKPPGTSEPPQQQLLFQQQPQQQQQLPPSLGGPDDPMLQMMRAMGLELPDDFARNMPRLPGMPFPNGPETGSTTESPMSEPSWTDRLFPIFNLLCVFGLVAWWAPWKTKLVEQTMNQDEWDRVETGASSVGFGSAPVFWMFVSAELTLQATRWLLRRNTPPSPGMLTTLLFSLPAPYSTIAGAGLKYYAILGSFWDDLCLLVFGVGVAVIWAEWPSTPLSSVPV